MTLTSFDGKNFDDVRNILQVPPLNDGKNFDDVRNILQVPPLKVSQ
jgi:hypothetical protein